MTPEQHDIFNVSLLGLVLGGLLFLAGAAVLTAYRLGRAALRFRAERDAARAARDRAFRRAIEINVRWMDAYDRVAPGERAAGEVLSLNDEYPDLSEDPDLADLVDALAANDPKENPSA